jgi:hypothetical protein
MTDQLPDATSALPSQSPEVDSRRSAAAPMGRGRGREQARGMAIRLLDSLMVNHLAAIIRAGSAVGPRLVGTADDSVLMEVGSTIRLGDVTLAILRV